jgi:hypothetical protein
MLPTTSITMFDVAFVILFVVVFCEVLRIVVLGLKSLHVRDDNPALGEDRPGDSLVRSDGA